MNRTEKASIVSTVSGGLKAAPFVLLTEYKGTTVADVTSLRKELGKSGMKFRVLKNTLAKRAFAEVGITGLDDQLKGMTGILTSNADGIGSARVLKDLLKNYPTVKVRAGFFDGAAMDENCVKVVAELPGREELLSQLLATLQAGPQGLVRLIAAPAQQLIQVLANYESKLAEAETAEAGA